MTHQTRIDVRSLPGQWGLSHTMPSLCTDDVETRIKELDMDMKTAKNEKSKHEFTALQYVLLLLRDEKCIDMIRLFDEYLSMLPRKYQLQNNRKSRIEFRDKILGHKGLPVIVVHKDITNVNYVMLVPGTFSDRRGYTEAIDSLVTQAFSKGKSSDSGFTDFFSNAYKMLSTARDRAIVVAVLTHFLSNTKIRNLTGIAEDDVNLAKENVSNMNEMIPEQDQNIDNEVDKSLENTLLQIESSIQKLEMKKSSAGTKRKYDEIVNDVNAKRLRLNTLRMNPARYKIRCRYRLFTKYKQSVLSKKGIQKKRQIDPRIEDKLAEIMAEHFNAHERRHGDLDTGYLEGDLRLHNYDLKAIANKILMDEGATRLIKSAETIRSMGRPRNKRSIQAKQHRGKGLWKHQRPAKTLSTTSINIHYNRAQAKHFERLAFSTQHAPLRDYVVRKAIDDKAKVICGTSTGFSRPGHKPIILNEAATQLPYQDYPEQAKELSPGVILISKQKEVETEDDIKFCPTADSVHTVTCKAKCVYASTATNWFNDMYNIRVNHPKDHETPSTESLPLHEIDSTIKMQLLKVRDRMLQFNLQTLRDDYIEVNNEDCRHKSREKLRIEVLKTQVQNTLEKLAIDKENEVIEEVRTKLQEIKNQLDELESALESKKVDISQLDKSYKNIIPLIQAASKYLTVNGISLQRPIEIQSSDNGPGVSTSEKMCQLRMAEHFLINDLQFFSRHHYAAGDSRRHVVEKDMRHLNEALGDGREIKIDEQTLFGGMSLAEVMKMNDDILKETMQEKMETNAKKYAEKLADRYHGYPCMGSSFHAYTPPYNLRDRLFFDEEYAKAFVHSSESQRGGLAGASYYGSILAAYEMHFRNFNGGVQASANACSEKPCKFHNDDSPPHWAPMTINWITQPVPDRSKQKFTYERPENVLVDEPPSDEFCPSVQLNKIMSEIEPVLEAHVNESESHIQVSVRDKTNTKLTMYGKADDFALKYTGIELKDVVLRRIDHWYTRTMKAFIRKNSRASEKIIEQAKPIRDHDWEKYASEDFKKVTVPIMDEYLIVVLGYSRAQVKRKGFNKQMKGEAIKKDLHKRARKSKSDQEQNEEVFVVHDSGVDSSTQILPWGGQLVTDEETYRLINTCPVDNMIFLIYMLAQKQDLGTLVPLPVSQTLATMVEHISRREYTEAKWTWMESNFPGFPEEFLTDSHSQKVDLWGNEEDMFISKLNPLMASRLSSECSSENCPKRLLNTGSITAVLR